MYRGHVYGARTSDFAWLTALADKEEALKLHDPDFVNTIQKNAFEWKSTEDVKHLFYAKHVVRHKGYTKDEVYESIESCKACLWPQASWIAAQHVLHSLWNELSCWELITAHYEHDEFRECLELNF